ncbi:hypothetical protein NEICINOT_04242 [Neisseria cinerea ATCC 14685]|uniref:Uncharacterized protein n=1 Tax=Neisseria cinerea ATCC 14685 TaxID=546262 RepID=D0W3K2_NEICI|nr:hypothetical protein NEICINOT_04242 [Neisseria cinerea ATCC 14685]
MRITLNRAVKSAIMHNNICRNNPPFSRARIVTAAFGNLFKIRQEKP